MAKHEHLTIPEAVIVSRVEDLVRAKQRKSPDSKLCQCSHCKKHCWIDSLAKYYSENGAIILCRQCELVVGTDFEEMPDILVPTTNEGLSNVLVRPPLDIDLES